jgi:hypothetical protein
MTRAFRLLVLIGGITASAVTLAQGQQATPEDGKREFTITGCLLRAGYASYKVEDAKVDAIDGKAVPAASPNAPATKLVKTWTLEGGGNLGPRVGEKVEVVGRSDWKESSDTDGPAAKPPTLEVKSVKSVAPSCS